MNTAPDLSHAAHIVAQLPTPDYAVNYQPVYPHQGDLVAAVHELRATTPVATHEQVRNVRATLAAIATGEHSGPFILEGRCAEPVVGLETPVEALAVNAMVTRRVVLKTIPTAVHGQRGQGQAFKPRSSAHEQLADGRTVVSYMGDGINSLDPTQRTPSPRRMVEAAIQARALSEALATKAGEPVIATHEALLLAYEYGFLHLDPETGNTSLLSAHVPWIGKRTNALDGPHVAMLAGVQNTVGVKIGPDSTAEHIAGLSARLNPNNEPGKLIFMLRVGLGNTAALHTVTHAIAEHAPNALNAYDIHGVTRLGADGKTKVRAVPEIIEEIRVVSNACREAGTKLHSLHLETTHDPTRYECVDHPDELPTDKPVVDPLLNPDQLRRILEETAENVM